MISANRIIAKLHKDFLLATVIFVVAMVVYLSNGRMIESSDVVPASVLPVLNVREKTIYFDDMLSEVQYYIHGRNPYDYFLVKTRGHVVSWFPIVLPVVLIPLYFFYNLSLEIRNIPFSFYNFKYVESHISFLKLSASLIAAFSGVSLYLILKMIWKSSKVALLTTFIYLFCASAWVINSQELWQHGLGNLLFFILIFLYLLTAVYGFSKSIFLYFLMGGTLSLFILNRPSALLLSIPFFLMFPIMLNKRFYRNTMAYLLGFLFLGMPFFLYNQYFLGNYLLGSYALITDAFHLPKLTSLAGLLISPSRGLFIYSPVFLFSFFGAFLLVKSSFSRRTYFLKLLGLVGVLYLLFLSGFASWTGSWSYGPRYLTDLLPILAIYLSYFINHLLRRNFRYKQFYFSVFFIAAIFSFFVQYIGAFYFTYQWDARVEKSGVSFEEAAWDWKSPQILSIFSE